MTSGSALCYCCQRPVIAGEQHCEFCTPHYCPNSSGMMSHRVQYKRCRKHCPECVRRDIGNIDRQAAEKGRIIDVKAKP